MCYLLSVRGEFLSLSSAQTIALRSVLSTQPPLFLQASHLASRSKLPNWVFLSISNADEKGQCPYLFCWLYAAGCSRLKHFIPPVWGKNKVAGVT